jgi:hypothetical protein
LPYPGWNNHRISQYKKILATGAPKSEAAAIVNTQRKKKGELKKKKKVRG